MITARERRLSSFNKEKIMQRCIFIYDTHLCILFTIIAMSAQDTIYDSEL